MDIITNIAVAAQVAFALETAAKWTAQWPNVTLPECIQKDTLEQGVWRAEQTDGGGVRITGDAEGLRLGVYAWCKALGIRWFSPNESPLIPEKPKAIPASFFGHHKPSFPYRGLHSCGCPDHFDPNIARWMSFNGFNRRLDTLREAAVHHEEYARLGLVSDTTVHCYSLVLPPSKYFAEHPEYYPLIGGKRLAAGGELCLSNQEMRRAFADSLREWLEKAGDVSPVGICPNDGYGWCECDACRALDTEEDRKNGTVNGRIADFVKFICAEFPDRTIGHYSYSNFADFYKLIDPLPKNLMLSFTAFHCQGHQFLDENCPRNDKFAKRTAELRAKGARFYIYDYYTYGWGFLPAPMWKIVARDFKAWRDAGVEGFLSEVSKTGSASWDSFWPSLLMAGEMMLDADADHDAIIDDWCQARYGRAAMAMREYFRVWERGLDGTNCFLKTPDEFPLIFRADAEAPLAQAEKDDPDNPFVKQARKQYDAWKANLELRNRYATPGEVEVSSELRKIPVFLVDRPSQTVDAENDTETEMAVADGKVRLRLTAHETRMDSLKTASSVYDSDCFEIFIADGEDPKRTYHFIADHSGRVRAADSKGSRWNWNWEHHAKVTPQKESDRWIIDFEMPLSDACVTDPSQLRFTIIRNRHAGGKWQILGAPAGGAFFDTARYIRVKPAQ